MDNNSCIGYIIKAMENEGYTKEQIENIINELMFLFDVMTEGQAKKIYEKF